jgi:uncharacterized protein (TIGR03435 family)
MKSADFVIAMLFASVCGLGQEPLLPKLVVASIKELAPNDARSFFECGAGRLTISGNRLFLQKITACGLINMAYSVQDFEVIDAPRWTREGWPLTYEIQAIAEGSEPLTRVRANELLQVVLAERFQLKFHKEMRELSVYALIVGREGPKFTAAMPSSCVTERGSAVFRMSVGPDGIIADRPGFMGICQPAPISNLTRVLMMQLDRPVVDRTALTDTYRFELKWDDRSTLFSGLQEQLGLQLVARKEQVEVMVIDRMERPSAN